MALRRAFPALQSMLCRHAHKTIASDAAPALAATFQPTWRSDSFVADSLCARGYSTAIAKATEKSANYMQAITTPSGDIQYDESVHQRYAPGDVDKKAFTYFLLTGGRFVYAAGARLIIVKFLTSMSASKDVLALASTEVNLSSIAEGSCVTIKWRGKPVFIRSRTEAEIADATSVDVASLRDPQTDAERTVNPKWLITVGVCTHLGCVPLPNAGDFGGWFCPCHGSHYDVSGRIRKGPAPYNLEIPEYSFLDDENVVIG